MRQPVLGDHEGGEETHSLTASCKDPSPWAPVVAVFSVQGGSLRSFTESSPACGTGAEGGLTPTAIAPSLPTVRTLAAFLLPSKPRGSGCVAFFLWSVN